jgi:hypothetical protein
MPLDRSELNASDADVGPDTPLPDVPDAGDDSQPLLPPEPVNISTSTLAVDGALVAGTLDDDDNRTLYEQALDAYETTDEGLGTSEQRTDTVGNARRARIYE